jgi:hypothetical protein
MELLLVGVYAMKKLDVEPIFDDSNTREVIHIAILASIFEQSTSIELFVAIFA